MGPITKVDPSPPAPIARAVAIGTTSSSPTRPSAGCDRNPVLTALRTLSTDHRRMLFECYFRGASVAEAAETLGVPTGTIKSRTDYALRALRRATDDRG